MSATQCNELQLLLPDWIKEQERNTHHTLITKHLSLCSSCSNEAEGLKKLFMEIERDEAYIPPQQYFVNLLPRIHERIERKKKRAFYWRIIQFSAPVTAIIIFGFFLWNKPTPTISQTQPDFEMSEIFVNADSIDLQQYQQSPFAEEFATPIIAEQTILSDDDKNVIRTIVAENFSSSTIPSYVSENDDLLASLSDDEIEQLAQHIEQKLYK